MKSISSIFQVVITIVAGFSFAGGEEPLSPSAAYLEFRRLVMAGDAEQSWDYLTKDSQDAIREIDNAMADLAVNLVGSSNDPISDRLMGGLIAKMHLGTDPVRTDMMAWQSVLDEASDTRTEAYFQPGFYVTSEIVDGDKAILTIEGNCFKRKEIMIKENGEWKIAFPYIVSLAQAGWQIDMADYLGKLNNVMSMNRGAGLNLNKMDISVRDVMKK